MRSDAHKKAGLSQRCDIAGWLRAWKMAEKRILAHKKSQIPINQNLASEEGDENLYNFKLFLLRLSGKKLPKL